MDVLMASGFITPPSIHYVRNHGAVPKLQWDTHTITINGLVEQQLTISMEELVAMPSVTMPITLVCAGETSSSSSTPLNTTHGKIRAAAGHRP